MTYLSEACKPYGLVKKLSAFNNTNDIVLYVSEAFIFDEVAELLAIMPVSAYNEPIEYITDFTDEKNTVEGDYTFIQGKDVTLVGPDGSHTLMKSTLCFPNLDLISNGGKLP